MAAAEEPRGEGKGAAGRARLPADFAVRTASGLAMLGVAGVALGLGGVFWLAFVLVIAAGIFAEWLGLVRRFASGAGRLCWVAAGVGYVGLAAAAVIGWERAGGFAGVLALIGAVIATDIGAYAFGRTIGGPRIAPAISPAKTWAGLGGGMLAAACWLALLALAAGEWVAPALALIMGDGGRALDMVDGGRALAAGLAGALIAMVAQAGDFFQSWMKRRAGVKDSGSLLAGHGGLFDRTDGMLAVALLGFVVTMVAQ